MKVAIFGANGQIGQHTIKKLQDNNNHEATAIVRKKEQQESFEKQGVTSKLADLEDSVDSIVEAIKGADAVVFTAGSGAKTGPDKTLTIDLDGAIKTVKAAEKAGIKKYIMISAFQANNREMFNAAEGMKPYYVAKHYADEFLKFSKLDYTIIRPGGLLNDAGTGKVKVGDNTIEPGSIPREDVAATIIAALDKSNLKNESFDLVSGEQAIADALDTI